MSSLLSSTRRIDMYDWSRRHNAPQACFLYAQRMAFVLIALVLTGAVFTSAFRSTMNGNQVQESILFDLNMGLATDDYVVHDPIEIWSDADFVSQGWPGSGTPEDPYRIEGLSIDGVIEDVYVDTCIRIGYTQVYFVVSNCFLYWGEGFSWGVGLSLTDVRNGLIEHNNFTLNSEAIHLHRSTNNIIRSNDLYANKGIGIYLWESDNNTLADNDISDNHDDGIWVYHSHWVNILNNTCNQNLRDGIYVNGGSDSYSHDLIIANNTCEDNAVHGIKVFRGVSSVLANNTCSGNHWGLYVSSSTLMTVTGNVCCENSWFGIWLLSSENISVTWNALIDNENNGGEMDSSSPNLFDYNYWSDYNGVDGNCDGIGDVAYHGTGMHDSHPLMYPLGSDPLLGSPDDIEYEESTIGHSISWFLSILNSSSYRVYRNGSLVVDSGVWSGPITVSVDGLSLGTHNYTLVIFDTNGNSANDTVFVTVVEPVSPIIDSPDDIQYESGTTGNIITWSPSDLNPESYEILRNGTQIDSGLWGGSDIEISIDGLDLGIHNFALVVLDTSGNNASDTVMVSIVDTTDPALSSPKDIQFKVGDVGHKLSWHLQDMNPFSYEVFMDVTLIISGAWNSSGEIVTVMLDGLSVGVLFFTIYVTDLAGNEAFDMVTVIVLSDSTITTTTGETTDNGTTDGEATDDDQAGLSVIVGAVIGVVCIIIVIVLAQRRRE